MSHRLKPHPQLPAPAIRIEADLTVRGDVLTVEYRISDTGLIKLPAFASPERTDNLWQTTCFELFIQPAGSKRYVEFNFSPSTRWAAYAFEDYFAGRTDLEISAPAIQFNRARLVARLDLNRLPPRPWRVGLTAVIEEHDGRKSWWALLAARGKPDFHDADCFALEVPAASPA